MKFLKAELELIDLYEEDIITASAGSGDDDVILEPGELPRI